MARAKPDEDQGLTLSQAAAELTRRLGRPVRKGDLARAIAGGRLKFLDLSGQTVVLRRYLDDWLSRGDAPVQGIAMPPAPEWRRKQDEEARRQGIL